MNKHNILWVVERKSGAGRKAPWAPIVNGESTRDSARREQAQIRQQQPAAQLRVRKYAPVQGYVR